jgi:multidrug efflux pump subunit AcrA (membrane-fusion protein)
VKKVESTIWQTCILIVGCASLFSCGGSDHSAAKKIDHESAEQDSEPTVQVVRVKEGFLNETLTLPGELRAYQDVPIHAKVEGYISWIGVDRGSVLKKGDKMITIYCPELVEKLREAEAKVSAAQASYKSSKAALDTEISKQIEFQAKLNSDKLTYERLAEAAKTPGAIAQNEVDMAFQTVNADKARVASQEASVAAARSVVVANHDNVSAARNVFKAMQAMQSYLTIEAPFDGVITERNVHTGSIVAVDAARKGVPLVRIQQKNLLRLVVPVPEEASGGIESGKTIPFSVPAYIGKTFVGTIARLGFALDSATRTMPVELNAWNPTGELEPGMFATVQWPATRTYKTLFVPAAAVGTDLKGTYVVKIENDRSERLTAKRGQPMGDDVEVIADGLKQGDEVALRATDEIQNGTKLVTKVADEKDIKASKRATQAGGE